MLLRSSFRRTGLLLVSLLLAAWPAWAAPDEQQKKDAARKLAREGLELMHDERWAEARAVLGRAYELVPAPTVAVLEARSLEKLGKLVEAAERYEAARSAASRSDESEAFRRAIKEAEDELPRLKRKIPKVTLALEGPGRARTDLRVLLDDRVVAVGEEPTVFADPGGHVVRALVGERAVDEERFDLTEGEARTVTLFVPLDEKDAPAPPAPSPAVAQDRGSGAPPDGASAATTMGWLSLGVGAAGLAVGGAFGLVMLDAKDTLDDACRPLCPESARDDLSRFRTARTVSAIGWGTGIVGVTVGAVLLLSTPAQRADTTSFFVDGRRAYVRGRF